MTPFDAPPDESTLIAELTLVRDEGLPRLRRLSLPALTATGRAITSDMSSDAHIVVETVLRRATARLGGGHYGDAAAALLGLDSGTRGLNSRARREIAAEAFERTYETFRKNYEPHVLEQLAAQILVLCSERRMRAGRDRLVARHPVESEIALHWIEMFQAYYRLWTPIYALGADLTAARSTVLEKARPYDRRYGTSGPNDQGYSQEEQAEGYARFALYWYSLFEWELRRFRTLYGGLWMLSASEIESDVRDAVYAIYWNIHPLNERDVSVLRSLLDDTPEQELHPFLERLAADDAGRVIHGEWQEWVASCTCVWPAGSTGGEDYFPTHENQEGISVACSVHQVVAACGRYCELIDEDWATIADWYQLDDQIQKGVSAEERYAAWREGEARLKGE